MVLRLAGSSSTMRMVWVDMRRSSSKRLVQASRRRCKIMFDGLLDGGHDLGRTGFRWKIFEMELAFSLRICRHGFTGGRIAHRVGQPMGRMYQLHINGGWF